MCRLLRILLATAHLGEPLGSSHTTDANRSKFQDSPLPAFTLIKNWPIPVNEYHREYFNSYASQAPRPADREFMTR